MVGGQLRLVGGGGQWGQVLFWAGGEGRGRDPRPPPGLFRRSQNPWRRRGVRSSTKYGGLLASSWDGPLLLGRNPRRKALAVAHRLWFTHGERLASNIFLAPNYVLSNFDFEIAEYFELLHNKDPKLCYRYDHLIFSAKMVQNSPSSIRLRAFEIFLKMDQESIVKEPETFFGAPYQNAPIKYSAGLFLNCIPLHLA